MSFTFNQGYQEPISSFKMNEKIDRIYGANGVIKGFDIQSQGSRLLVKNLDSDIGEAIVNGTLIIYKLLNGEAPVSVSSLPNGTSYVYGLYSPYEKTFIVKLASTLAEAQGTWKVFLGHIVVSSGNITQIQGLVPTSDITKTVEYRKLTSLSTLARYVYDANSAVLDDVWKKVIAYVGDITFLRTTDKTTIVAAVNEIYKKLDDFLDNIEGELDIPNFAKREVSTQNNTVNCFQMKQFTTSTNVAGYIVIKLPITVFSNEVISLTIKGTNSSSGESFLLMLTGTLNAADSRWTNCTAYVIGGLPSSDVLFTRTSTDGICIVLGESNSNWGKINIALESVLVVNNSNTTKNIWRDNWNIKMSSTAPQGGYSVTVPIKTGGPQDGEFVTPSRRVSAGTGLLGGGALIKDISISADFGTGLNQVARGNHTHGTDYAPAKFEGQNYKVVVTDGTGKIVTSANITTTELEALDGIKSNIQTQLDSKVGAGHTHSYLPLSGGTVTGDVVVTGKTTTKDFTLDGRPFKVATTYPTNPTAGTILFKIKS